MQEGTGYHYVESVYYGYTKNEYTLEEIGTSVSELRKFKEVYLHNKAHSIKSKEANIVLRNMQAMRNQDMDKSGPTIQKVRAYQNIRVVSGMNDSVKNELADYVSEQEVQKWINSCFTSISTHHNEKLAQHNLDKY